MVRICACAIFLIQQITLLTGIMVKNNSGLQSQLPELSSHLRFSNSSNIANIHNILDFEPFKANIFKNKQSPSVLNYINTIKMRPSVILTAASYHPVSNNISRSFMRRAPISDSISHLIDVVKPIYEDDIESDISSPVNHHHSAGYIYKPPTFDKTTIFRDELKETILPQTSQELTKSVVTLDRFLKPILNGDSYNNALHPPINPVLALVLSRYGKYISGGSNPGIYSYMAVNNIHNNKPFGQYKYEYDEDPVYTR